MPHVFIPLRILYYMDGLSSMHQSYLTLISKMVDPESFLEAAKDKAWVKAMQEEIKALEENRTWELVSLL